MKILVTGSAGFIGYHLTKRLLEEGHEVVGLDNLNEYYSVSLKRARLAESGVVDPMLPYGVHICSETKPNYKFVRMDLQDRQQLPKLFVQHHFDCVVNLAAQCGVRYSTENPFAYIESNLLGFANLLECCRHNNVRHLVYASSSSVYGGNAKTPFTEEDRVDTPVSLYAATKKADELMASCYSKLYNLACTGLRFFTVYGPWGRPDMAPMLFADAIRSGKEIKVFNHGDMLRDFTYVDDIVEGITRVMGKTPKPQEDGRPHKIYNLGCSNPIRLMDFIQTMESIFNKEAKKVFLPMQPGDVYQTYADTSALERDFDYKPSTELKTGLEKLVEWYNAYYK
ncbi:MAG: NAD-dependent epimerase/dehydratase family protein [Paludibacteraceae bacterium]|nr:NAD-dependent epimerase/dehydratase family protein [Paludibacteraceae bacterium]